MSKLGVYIVGSFLAVGAVGVVTARPHHGDIYRTVVALTLSGAFNLAACNAAVAAGLAAVWAMVRLAFGRLHALETAHAWESLFKAAIFLIFGPTMMLSVSFGTSELFQLAPLLIFFVLHEIAAKRQQLFEESVASTAAYRYARLMLLLGCMFTLDALAVASFSSAITRHAAKQEAEKASLKGDESAVFVHSDASDALQVANILLLHWSLLAIQCVSTSLRAALHSFSGLIRRPDTAQAARVFVDIMAEVLNCAAYILFFRNVQSFTMPLYIRDVVMSVRRVLMLIRDYWRHRATMQWVMELPLPTEAQLRGEEEPPASAPTPNAGGGEGEAAAAAGSSGTTPPTAVPGSGEPAQCAICYDGVGDNPNGARCLPCGHIFHVQCLSRWLEKNGTCPYCRRDFSELRRKATTARRAAAAAANNNRGGNALPPGLVLPPPNADGRPQFNVILRGRIAQAIQALHMPAVAAAAGGPPPRPPTPPAGPAANPPAPAAAAVGAAPPRNAVAGGGANDDGFDFARVAAAGAAAVEASNQRHSSRGAQATSLPEGGAGVIGADMAAAAHDAEERMIRALYDAYRDSMAARGLRDSPPRAAPAPTPPQPAPGAAAAAIGMGGIPLPVLTAPVAAGAVADGSTSSPALREAAGRRVRAAHERYRVARAALEAQYERELFDALAGL